MCRGTRGGIALVCWSADRRIFLIGEFTSKTANNNRELPPRVRVRESTTAECDRQFLTPKPHQRPQAHGTGSGPARTAAFEPSTVHLWPRDFSCRFQSSRFWFWQALASGTACAGLRLIHHHQRAAALAYLVSRTPPRPGAGFRASCLYRRQKWEMEQTKTAALILLIKIHDTRLRNTRPPSFSGSRHLNAAPCTCDLGCRHRAAVVSVAAARLNSQARRDSDETQDNAPAACHKNKPLVACTPRISRATRDARGHAYLSESSRIM